MLEIPEEDKKLLLQLIDEKKISEELINKLVNKAIKVFSSRHFSNSPNSNFLKTKANSLALCS